jgi:hypothetical protein
MKKITIQVTTTIEKTILIDDDEYDALVESGDFGDKIENALAILDSRTEGNEWVSTHILNEDDEEIFSAS